MGYRRIICWKIESSPEEEEVSDPEIAVARTRNMEEFRKELSLKREARQRAIAAVSSEMDRLRRELDAEKEAHSETSKILDLLKSGQATNVVTKHDVVDEEDIRMVTNEALQHEDNDWRKIMKADPELDNNEADARALTDILKVKEFAPSNFDHCTIQIETNDSKKKNLKIIPDLGRAEIEYKIADWKNRWPPLPSRVWNRES